MKTLPDDGKLVKLLWIKYRKKEKWFRKKKIIFNRMLLQKKGNWVEDKEDTVIFPSQWKNCDVCVML